jgi:DNA-binding winged helix-turn-helix (wHTH) protein
VIYVFGPCELDTERYELRRPGGVIRLRRKVFQVLTYLLAHHDRIVSKQELCAQVWPQQFVSEAALENTIKAVRQAIGDSGRRQQLIQTVYSVGYRVIAAVEMHAAAPVTEGGKGVSATHSGAMALAPPRTDTAPVPTPLDRNTLYDAMHTLYTMAQTEVQRYGGTLQPAVGERILAVFGAPVAQEDHAQRAVLAALALRQHMSEQRAGLDPQHRTALSVRMGLDTELLAVGSNDDSPEGLMTVVGGQCDAGDRSSGTGSTWDHSM